MSARGTAGAARSAPLSAASSEPTDTGATNREVPQRSKIPFEFETDPLEAARHTLLRQVLRHAAAGTPYGSVASRARGAVASELLAFTTSDSDVCSDAVDEQPFQFQEVAFTPSADVADVARKLAVLVRILADIGRPDFESNHNCCLLLAAVSLADLTILGSTPLRLPDRATDRVLDQHDVDYWRGVAEELSQ